MCRPKTQDGTSNSPTNRHEVFAELAKRLVRNAIWLLQVGKLEASLRSEVDRHTLCRTHAISRRSPADCCYLHNEHRAANEVGKVIEALSCLFDLSFEAGGLKSGPAFAEDSFAYLRNRQPSSLVKEVMSLCCRGLVRPLWPGLSRQNMDAIRKNASLTDWLCREATQGLQSSRDDKLPLAVGDYLRAWPIYALSNARDAIADMEKRGDQPRPSEVADSASAAESTTPAPQPKPDNTEVKPFAPTAKHKSYLSHWQEHLTSFHRRGNIKVALDHLCHLLEPMRSSNVWSGSQHNLEGQLLLLETGQHALLDRDLTPVSKSAIDNPVLVRSAE